MISAAELTAVFAAAFVISLAVDVVNRALAKRAVKRNRKYGI